MTGPLPGLARLLLATALFPLSAAAETPIAIKAGRLIDVEEGLVRRDQWILVRDGRIVSVQAASATMPSRARIIDLSRFTVGPGLIDCHTHIIAVEGDAMADLRSFSKVAFVMKGGVVYKGPGTGDQGQGMRD